MKQFRHTYSFFPHIGNALSVVLLMAVAFCVSSCSKKNAPNFYGAKDEVLREILVSFEEKDYDTVLSKLDRYRSQAGVDKELISNLERIVNQNLTVAKANLALDAGNFTKATEELSSYAEADPTMKEAVVKIQNYAVGREKLELLRNATFSDDILKYADDFSDFLKTRKGTFPVAFSNYCALRVEDARKLVAKERNLASELIFQDAKDAVKAGRFDRATAVYTFFSVQTSEDAKSKIEYLTQQGLFDL